MARIANDYLRLLQSLLPRGKVWSRALVSRLTEFLHAEAEELTRLDNRTQVLLRERNTLNTTELIKDHENDLGLPDECTRDLTLSLAERRIAANVKLTLTGQQDKNYFIEIANRYGFDAVIEEFTPLWCGFGACGDPIGPVANIFYWKLTIFADETPILFLCGEGTCGDPLQKVSELVQTVFCFAQKFKPAHTILLTALGGSAFSNAFSDGFDSLPDGDSSGGFTQGFDTGFNLFYS